LLVCSLEFPPGGALRELCFEVFDPARPDKNSFCWSVVAAPEGVSALFRSLPALVNDSGGYHLSPISIYIYIQSRSVSVTMRTHPTLLCPLMASCSVRSGPGVYRNRRLPLFKRLKGRHHDLPGYLDAPVSLRTVPKVSSPPGFLGVVLREL
jgi:hypothetical protein